MAHHTVRSGYESLVDRLNRLPQGAPPSDTLHAILKLLFSEKEAGLVALLPIRPFTAGHAAKVWKMKQSEAMTRFDPSRIGADIDPVKGCTSAMVCDMPVRRILASSARSTSGSVIVSLVSFSRSRFR